MGLIAVNNCPVCGSSQRITATDGMARFKKDIGFHYLKHAAARLDVTVEQLVDTAKVFQCSSCHTFYCDPWISPVVASQVFTAGAPDHIAGWGNFEHWISSSNLNSVELANLALYRQIEKKIGRLSSYAEFGCPFQGFLLLFKAREEDPAGRMKLFAQAMRREPDVRWTKMTRLHHAATQWANRLVMGYHHIRAFKETLRAGKNSISPEGNVGSLPASRFLLTQDTTRAWGNNCVRYGGSCRYYAGQVLNADVLPFEEAAKEVARGDRERFDLLGMFNSLDHTSDPVGVIRNGLTMARHIVVATHHASYAGKQHQYAFDERFPQWLSAMLENAVVEDITDVVIGSGKRSVNYLFISSEARACGG
jgi:hypothetical protein